MLNNSQLQKIRRFPQKPGVYLYKDSAGVVIYVGKAGNLRSRVSSYFRPVQIKKHSDRIKNLVKTVADFDYIITNNEVESLLLENTLIKKYQPKFNVLLRDDKNYLFIKINLHDQIPTLEFARKVEDNAKYFGPFTSAIAARETVQLIRRIFPYCNNKKLGDKPCFYYHLNKCPGVCAGIISLKEYRETLQKITDFLLGRQTQVLKGMQTQMRKMSRQKKYEKAASLRDQIFYLNRIWEKQKIISTKKICQDIISFYQKSNITCINLFKIREGKLWSKQNFILENTKQLPDKIIIENFLLRYYLDTSDIPKEIIQPYKITTPGFNKILTKKFGKKIKLSIPSYGKKSELIKLGTENAKQYLENRTENKLAEEARLMSSLKELQRLLKLPKLPGRIEAYDISNIQGINAVGSMVVFDFARPKKQDYRKFKIYTKSTPDDFAMMAEMLSRRFKHSFQERVSSSWPLPDLILIDGGKGQLSVATKILKKYQLNIPIIGLAKRLEEIFLPNQKNPLTLPPNSQGLFLLERIRDEAHRFAVTYHRKLRANSAVSSILDQIPGLGPQKKKKLLTNFNSINSLRQANLTDLANIVGRKLAEVIKASL